MAPDRTDIPFPDAAEFTAHVASLHGLESVVDVGLAWTPELAIAYPRMRVAGVAGPDQGAVARSRYPFRGTFALDDDALARGLAGQDPARSALLVTGPQERICAPEGFLPSLAAMVSAAPLLVLATFEAEPVLSRLAAVRLRPEFIGRTRANAADDDRSAHLLVFDRVLARATSEYSHAPDDFRVVAIMAVYNEEDVIGPAIDKLIGDGVGVYVIDNWSTDRSNDIVRGFEGRGLVGLERFPESPGDRYVWRALLRRVAAVAADAQADWCIHHDADERRCGPWLGLGLRDALWRVDQSGFSAVDHTVANYRPTDNDFVPGTDFERHMRHFEFGRSLDLLLQIKAWKNVGQVDLATSGGHEAIFLGRRTFPYKFLLKHYPIRSQSHGERKVLRERVPRWDPAERAAGWHNHYDDVGSYQSFLRELGELIEDRGPETRTLYLPEMLSGAGLAARGLPAWALGGSVRRTIYSRSRPISRNRAYQRLRRMVLGPRGLGRRPR